MKKIVTNKELNNAEADIYILANDRTFQKKLHNLCLCILKYPEYGKQKMNMVLFTSSFSKYIIELSINSFELSIIKSNSSILIYYCTNFFPLDDFFQISFFIHIKNNNW